MAEVGVTGEHTTDGIPHGSTSLTPFLAIPGAGEALEFYCSVFGARIVDVTEFDGVLVHAELDFGSGRLQLGEPNPEYGLAPPPSEGACYSMGLYCPNVDDVVTRAIDAGAALRSRTPSPRATATLRFSIPSGCAGRSCRESRTSPKPRARAGWPSRPRAAPRADALRGLARSGGRSCACRHCACGAARKPGAKAFLPREAANALAMDGSVRVSSSSNRFALRCPSAHAADHHGDGQGQDYGRSGEPGETTRGGEDRRARG